MVKTEWSEQIEMLTDSQAGQLLKAWFRYHTDQPPDIQDPVVNIMFSFNRQYFDDNAARYAARVSASQGNGKKGGRPKNPVGFFDNLENPVGFLGSEEKPKKPVSESESVSESVSVSPNGDKKAHTRRKKAKEPQEPKVQWAEFVTMTNAEHQKLLDTYGPADTARLIEILDLYKGRTGKTYKNDYRAVLAWCVDALEEEKAKGKWGSNGRNYQAIQAPDLAQRTEESMERMRRVIDAMKWEDGEP